MEHYGKVIICSVIGIGLYYIYSRGWLSQEYFRHDLIHLFFEAVK